MFGGMLKNFFMWSTILNAGMVAVTVILWMSARGFIYKIHGRLFNLNTETLDIIYYSFVGLYKLLIIVFNLVPWLVLEIMV